MWQAVARLVAQFFKAQNDLRKTFKERKDDKVALTQSLNRAMSVGLTPDFSPVMKEVQQHLQQAMLCIVKN